MDSGLTERVHSPSIVEISQRLGAEEANLRIGAAQARLKGFDAGGPEPFEFHGRYAGRCRIE